MSDLGTIEWRRAGAIYTSFFIILTIFKYQRISSLGLNKDLYGSLSRLQGIELFSRILVGMNAPSYIHYLIILELGIFLFRSFILKDQVLMDLWWKLIGLFIGYLLVKLPTPQQFYEDPQLPSPSRIIQHAKTDILSSQRPNPWIGPDDKINIRNILF